MAVIESAWESHPGYRIDLVPYPGVARAWHGDLLLAESTAALRVIETDHVERLYFPESDVRLDLFEHQRPPHDLPVQGRGRLLDPDGGRPRRSRTCSGPTATRSTRWRASRAISGCTTRRSGSSSRPAGPTTPGP